MQYNFIAYDDYVLHTYLFLCQQSSSTN